MTVETRTVFELKDITGLELACPRCGAKFIYSLHGVETRREIHKCPGCNEPWFVTERATQGPRDIQTFLTALETLERNKDVLARLRICTGIEGRKVFGQD